MDLPDSLGAEDFRRVIQREHERLELKTGAGRRPLQEAVVAFSNTDGGAVLIGVRDDRTVVGRRRDQGLDDDVHGAARDAHDVGRFDIREVLVGGRPVVAVVVQPRQEGFAQTSDGRVLVRRGGHNVALLGSELRDFISKRSLRSFEAEASGLDLRHVTAASLDVVKQAHGWTGDMSDRLLERGLLRRDGELTMAGALLLTDPLVALKMPKYGIDLRGYETRTGDSFVRRELITGPLHAQIERATSLVMRDLGTDMIVTGARRHELPRLPPAAIREAIANAVAHRNYELTHSSIVIEVRPHALIVTSPGRLPEPVTIATLRQGQAARNPVVIDVLRRLGLAEDSGRGIDLIQDELLADFLPDPVFEEDAAWLRVQLSTGRLITIEERAWLAEHQRQHDLDEMQSLLLVKVVREGAVTNGSARAALGIDSTQTRALLRSMRDRGLLVQQGQRGGAVYVLGRLVPQVADAEVLIRAAAQEPLTNSRVRQLLGVDRRQALTLLQGLVEQGRLEREGDARGSIYTLP